MRQVINNVFKQLPHLQYIANSNKLMSFINRENRQANQNQPTNRAFGRGGIHNQMDQAQMNQKMSQQQLYKQELQRQIMQKQQRKKKQQEKIRKEDEKFMREVEQLSRQQKQQKQRQKAKQQRAFENANNNTNLSPNPKKQLNNKQNNKASRVVGNLNIGIKDQKQQREQMPRQQQPYPQLPKLGFDLARQQYEDNPPAYTAQRRRPYMYDDYEPANQYYEERIRRHKQQMNQKLDELFHHIHSTKDNIKADEEIEKIKRRLRSKQSVGVQFSGGDSQVQLEYENKFYHVPKKLSSDYSRSPAKSRALDYQSTSKFTKYNNVGAQSRTKVRTQYEDMYSLPDVGQNSNNYGDKWGSKPDQGKFLGNREALDFQIAKTLGDIDQFQSYLKQKE